ncbi:retrovirus-related pol polyprotein from transposon TNT 1-94 [Tanacetum coccineum]
MTITPPSLSSPSSPPPLSTIVALVGVFYAAEHATKVVFVPSLPLKSPVYHEPSVASVVSASVVDRSIGTDNPHLSLGSQADSWCIEHLRHGSIRDAVEYQQTQRTQFSSPFDNYFSLNIQNESRLKSGQLCDYDLEVAFRKYICFVRNLKGADLLTGSRDTNLYTLSLDDMLNTINKLAKQGLVSGLPKLKYEKDHLCFAYSLRKSKKHTHKPKSKNSIQEKLYLLHMDLCGPIRIESIDGKKYILVIVDDFSQFTWVKNLRSKNETLEFIIKFLKKVQVSLNATVRNIRTDNGTEKPDLKYFHVFGALCYPTNDRDDLGKLKPKADIEVFIGYSPIKKAYRIYNRRTRLIMETIHVDFDELTAMTFEQFGSGPELQLMTLRTISSGLVQNPSSSTPYASPTKKDWDILFQPMFDEYFQPSPSVVSRVLPVVALIPTDTIGVEEQLQPAQFDNDLFQDILTSEPSSQESSSNVHPSNPPFEHLSK